MSDTFPPSFCTAWEDCKHDGVCHDRVNCAATGPNDYWQEQCETCCGNGDIIMDWGRYLHSYPDDAGDEAVANCPDCDGSGYIEIGRI